VCLILLLYIIPRVCVHYASCGVSLRAFSPSPPDNLPENHRLYSHLFGYLLPCGFLFIPAIDAAAASSMAVALHTTNALAVAVAVLMLVPSLKVFGRGLWRSFGLKHCEAETEINNLKVVISIPFLKGIPSLTSEIFPCHFFLLRMRFCSWLLYFLRFEFFNSFLFSVRCRFKW